MADALRITLGPQAKSMLIEKKWGRPIICDDGVTIAKEMELADPEENLGAQMMREAAERTGEVVGDGTTTATIFLRAIDAVLHEAQQYEGDEKTGMMILSRALEAPTRQLPTNAGLDAGVVVSKMREGKEHLGLNARTGEYVDLMKAGIIDIRLFIKGIRPSLAADGMRSRKKSEATAVLRSMECDCLFLRTVEHGWLWH